MSWYPKTLKQAGTAISSSAAELNILDGVTTSAAELNILDGATSTAAELNILDGVTSTAAELNILDGVTSTTAELNILDGATVVVDEINALDGAPLDVDFTVGAEDANVSNVALQLNDAAGVALATRAALLAYLSDDANGDSIAGTAPDGGVAIGTDGLAIPLVAGKAFQLVSEADGDIDLNITESGTDTWYLIVVLPNGKLAASGAITFAA